MSLEKWLVAPGQTKIIDIELVRKLKVGLIGGKIDVIGHDEPGARIEVHSVMGKDLKISMDGDTLEIDHPQLRWDNFIEVFGCFRGTAQADLSLMVPRDVVLKLGVVSADALISGLRNDAKLSTVSGDLVIDDATGDLDLNAVNGEISVRNHVGTIGVHTLTGEVTASGSIRRFGLDGVSSDVFLDLEGTPDQVTTNTVSGNLTVRLGAGVAARYRLKTVTGTLQLDDQTVRTTLGKGYQGSIGSLDTSFLELNANSVSGSISVVRRDLPTEANTPTETSAPATGDAAAEPAAASKEAAS